MRNTVSLLALLLLGTFATGCANYGANVERKFGRGMANIAEPVRGGEFRRTMEQTAIFNGADSAYTTGAIRGVNRTIGRTFIGVYEIVTAPIPPYDPVFTDRFAPGPVYPDGYVPGVAADSMFATDSQLGFSGGDVLPVVPGSRFRVFDTY